MGELIAVLSGKGGTGKTSVCAGVATALAQMGETVLCIDCDVGLRNLDISLGMTESGALSFLDVAEGEQTPLWKQLLTYGFVAALVLLILLPLGVILRYDSEGEWISEGAIRGGNVQSFTIPVIPRRCDHMQIRLRGTGDVKIYSIAKILEMGSDV